MACSVQIKGQEFQDSTGLAVKVDRVDANHRLHFSVIHQEDGHTAAGEMSYDAFINRFTKIDPVENVREACARIKHLGYAAATRIRIYGEEFELLSDPFPQADGIAIHVKAKGDSNSRMLRLPLTFLQGIRGRRFTKAV